MNFLRVVAIANKWFEADAVMAVFANTSASPPVVQDYRNILWPRKAQTNMGEIVVRPRAAMLIGQDKLTIFEFWAIQDLMNPYLSFSNTAEKVRVLAQVFQYGQMPDLVIALGTAAVSETDSFNGCVFAGANAFLHNPYANKPNPASNWNDPSFMDKVLSSRLQPEFFVNLSKNTIIQTEIALRLLQTPLNPARNLQFVATWENTCVSDVNVINTADYAWADPESIATAQNNGAKKIASLDTTLGVIRALSDAPFMFISGITNRIGCFGTEVLPRFYAQNFVASQNTGIALAWLLPEVIGFLNTQTK